MGDAAAAPAPAAPAPADWPHLFRPGAGAVVLALHGTGGTETDAVALAERIAPGAAILSPRGRVSENGAGRWFRRASEGVFDVDDVILRAGELAAFVEWAVAEYGLDGHPLIVTGFSNGANMALALGMLHPQRASAVVAFSGMYPFGDRTLPRDLSRSRILLLNGTADPMAPQWSVDVLARTAAEQGAAIARVSRGGGHGILPAELAEAEQWIRGLAPSP